MSNIFPQIGIILILATLGGFVARVLKQPAIPFYILAGLLLGPIFGIVTNSPLITGLAEVGIAFLLFLVGTEINFDKLKEVAKFSVFSACLTTVITALVGYFITAKLGFSHLESLTLGFVFAISSTSIVLKILTDKKEIDTLPGRILITFLLIQDIFAIIFLTFVSGSSLNIASSIALIAKLVLALSFVTVSSMFFVKPIFKLASKSSELLFLTALSSCFLFGSIFYYSGLSIAIGAFLAGLMISSTPYKFDILGKIKPIRDFFATIFFVSLGLMVSKNLSGLWPTITILTVFVVLIKPFLILTISAIAGYKKQTSYTVSIFLAQASEFSLIIVITGFHNHILSQNILSIAAIVSILSIMISSYLMAYNQNIYQRISKYLKIFEKRTTKEELMHLPPEKNLKDHYLVLGADRIGYDIVITLDHMKRKLLVVDYNPTVIKNLRKKKINCLFGDITDSDILERVGLKKAKMVICTIPGFENNMMILRKTKLKGIHPIVYCTAQTVEDSLKLYNTGADYVVLPQLIGGSHVSHILKESEEKWEKFLEFKNENLKKLKKRFRENEIIG